MITANDNIEIIHDDCIRALKQLPDNSLDSCVTDPPYGINLGKMEWDAGLPPANVWKEVLRVLKPGAYCLAFGSTRTIHRQICDIEDVGFSIKDQVAWHYAQGFPASRNIARDIDRIMGVEPTDAGPNPNYRNPSDRNSDLYHLKTNDRLTVPTSPEAKAHAGKGTGLKPSMELIVVAQKPTTSTLARCVLDNGTGALNIDACRNDLGKWPSNVIHDGSPDVLDQLDKAASFYFCAKPSKAETHYAKHPTIKPIALMRYLVRLVTPQNGTVLDCFAGSGTTGLAARQEGRGAILIEREEDYVEIIRQRLKVA